RLGRRRPHPRRVARSGHPARGHALRDHLAQGLMLGGEQVEGRRAVLELLRARRRRVRTVSVSSSARADSALEEIRARAGDALKVVGPERIDAMARTDAPQGVVATATPLVPADLDDLLRAPDAFLVALDGVTDPRNLGAIARVAETAGADGLVLPRHRS